MDKEIKEDIKFLTISSCIIIGVTIISKLIGYIWTYLIAKQGAEVFGYLSLIMGFISLYTSITTLWINKQTVRNIFFLSKSKEEKKKKEIVGQTFYLILFMNVIFIIFIALFYKQIAYYIYKTPFLASVLLYVTLFSFVNNILKGISGYAASKRDINIPAIMSTIGVASTKLIVFILLYYIYKIDILVSAITSFLIANFINALFIYFYNIKKYHLLIPSPTKVMKDKELTKKITLYSLPLGISKFIGIITNHINLILINVYKGIKNVGVYSITNPFLSLFQLISLPVQRILSLIIIQRIHEKKKEKVSFLLSYLMKYVFIIISFLFIVLTLYGKEIITGIFGKEYSNAYKVLIILLISQTLIFISSIYFQIYWSEYSPTYHPKITLIGSAIYLTLNTIFIPLYGIIGSAIANLIATLITSFYHIYKSYKVMPLIKIPLSKILLSYIISFVVLKVINIVIHLFIPYLSITEAIIMLLISGILYLSSLFITKTISFNEINKIKNLFIKEILNI